MAFGDPQSGGDNSKTAEGILTQIKGLLHQYIDLGDTTPLKSEAESFMDDVQSGLDRLKGEAESSSEDTTEGGESTESGASSPSDFRGATKAARDAMRNGNLSSMHDGTKTPEEEAQSQDEEKKKKSSKAY